MAQSPSHQFGQFIGEMLEEALRPPLSELCDRLGFYLDTKHPRPARNQRRKVSWKDGKGNVHDLDFVIEDGGTEEQIGRPRAFIEIAWRRYTKHSRNKAQEIQGAIVPLAQTYSSGHPFLGVVLAGEFTANSLTQLRSHGFHVLHFSYEQVLNAFSAAGIDAAFDESTPDRNLERKVSQLRALSAKKRRTIPEALRAQQHSGIRTLIDAVDVALSRRVIQVGILMLFGRSIQCSDVASAIDVLAKCKTTPFKGPFVRFEVDVRFSNGDEIRASFQSIQDAIAFLRQFG